MRLVNRGPYYKARNIFIEAAAELHVPPAAFRTRTSPFEDFEKTSNDFAGKTHRRIFRTTDSFICLSMLSNACQYGLRAMIHLAKAAQDRFVPVRETSAALDVSHAFLAKILQQLVSRDLLISHRGPSGGVRLARSASSIVLNDIVLAIDGRKVFDSCVLGLPGCGERAPCPLHEAWGDVRSRFCRMLEETTLDDLAQRTEASNLRLTPD